jgi:LacI family transcriptional regulator
MIVQSTGPELDAAVQAMGVPAVNISMLSGGSALPTVVSDNPAIGEMAARYFLDRGLEHMAVFNIANYHYVALRRNRFTEVATAAGVTPQAYQITGRGAREREDERILRWLMRLPKPVGVFVPDDLDAIRLSDVCLVGGIHVPEEVAILGAGDEVFVCSLAYPPLSSVKVPGELVGREAARLLDAMLSGEPGPETPILLAPAGVETRGSTQVLGLEDQDVRDASFFIEQNAHRPIRVRDVVAAVHVSRQVLEKRFRRLRGRTIHDEIRLAHLARAKALLLGTDIPISEVANKSGFRYATYLATVFREELGISPSDFRDEYRKRGGGPEVAEVEG